MKCLVTGGAGFIGSHLCERLIEDGHEVLAIDNLSVGRIANLERLLRNDQFKFETADVSFRLSKKGHWLARHCKDIDWVFHLAALADIVPSITNPLDYHRANVEGTVALLEAARTQNVKRFIYAASSSCYGIPKTYPTPETEVCDPRYPYALTKYVGEQYVMHWAKVYKLPALSLRFFNVYGPRARTSGTYGAVFGVFLSQLYHKQPLTVVGDGTQKRDFTFVTDVVNALVMSAKSNLSGEILNVGSGNPKSINELIKQLDSPVFQSIPKRPGEPDITHADITKIAILLGWRPQVSFEEGVKKMLEHLGDFSNAPLWNPCTIKDATKKWFEHLA